MPIYNFLDYRPWSFVLYTSLTLPEIMWLLAHYVSLPQGTVATKVSY